jgi:hypothetical protein
VGGVSEHALFPGKLLEERGISGKPKLIANNFIAFKTQVPIYKASALKAGSVPLEPCLPLQVPI